MRRGVALWGILLLVGICHVSLLAQVATSSVQIQAVPTQTDGPTVDDFREYLNLSGVGEVWRAGWIAAVEPNWKRIAPPYWPESFKQDILDEMKKADLAPSVWNVYHSVYSKEELAKVNAILRDQGIPGYLASPMGKSFCADWAKHEDEGHQQMMTLTTSLMERVYQRDQPIIKAARAEYIKTHPDYKD